MNWKVRCAAMSLATLAACSKSSSSYAPLEPRLSWQYDVHAQPRDADGSPGAPLRGESSMRNLPARQIDGREVTPQSVQLGAQFSTIFRFEDGDGVHVAAVQSGDAAEPEITTGQFDLRYPLVVGRSWNDTSESMFLAGSVEVSGESRIEALDDTVTVPAGTYEDCLRVRFVGEGSGQVPGRFGQVAVAVESVRWFAPGVGMVKYQHEDRSDAGGGAFTAELKSFKQL